MKSTSLSSHQGSFWFQNVHLRSYTAAKTALTRLEGARLGDLAETPAQCEDHHAMLSWSLEKDDSPW